MTSSIPVKLHLSASANCSPTVRYLWEQAKNPHSSFFLKALLSIIDHCLIILLFIVIVRILYCNLYITVTIINLYTTSLINRYCSFFQRFQQTLSSSSIALYCASYHYVQEYRKSTDRGPYLFIPID